jgi:hypothetical protein
MRIGPAAVAALAVAVASVVVGAALAASFSDPVGDTMVLPPGGDVTGVTAPDITSVEVTNTPDGILTFRISLANTALSAPTVVGVVLDLDKDPSTGENGVEAIIDLAYGTGLPGGLVFDRWNGSELEEVVPTRATVTPTEGLVTITVPRSELFDTRGLGVGAVAFAENVFGTARIADIAPDDEDFFLYDLVGLPPPPPPRLSASRAVGAPARPRAGEAFVVSTRVRRDDAGAVVTSGRVACSVRVGGARIRAGGAFASRRARCTMRVPATARGKTLRGSMTIRSAGSSVTRAFAFRVG